MAPNDNYEQARRPMFSIGQHDSNREVPLDDIQYGQILNAGINWTTSPITNKHFHDRVRDLVSSHFAEARKSDEPLMDPVVPSLTTKDTSLFPRASVTTYTAYASPWIDLASPDPVIASVSRQVLNFEVAYANFVGVRSVVVPGPRWDASKTGGAKGVSQYARAVQEAMKVGARVHFTIHLPMYREPGLEEGVESLSTLIPGAAGGKQVGAKASNQEDIDIYSAWDTWHSIRSICDYSAQLSVGVRVPRALPEKELQDKWFAEPLRFLSIGEKAFGKNKGGNSTLPKAHQEMIFYYMRLKNTPALLLCDVGPDPAELTTEAQVSQLTVSDFPSLTEAHEGKPREEPLKGLRAYVSYLKYLEGQQRPLSFLEYNTLTSFQDWLQSPLQPLSDNLESATYEVFEGDPVKYNQYEAAITKALSEWKTSGKKTSSGTGSVVIAVVGSGRGPLVTRALMASKTTGVPVQVWAVEKNPNAYVYLLRQNEVAWDGKVMVVKTDMRSWKGPLLSGTADDKPIYGQVDILVSELLGSFGDNELSPECLDGVQHVLAPHGISIPESYTAHLSPIATPRIHADILTRLPTEPEGFDTPWVVHLFAIDFAAQRVPDHPRFQQAWEFSHPIPKATLKRIDERMAGGVMGGGGGSMNGGVGGNEHNSRMCHLTFVCRTKGVIHGLAGYFESVLYQPIDKSEPAVEISTHPERIDQKSKDMISWFPIFFPIKQPITYPADSELEVTMWRQTDDRRVWYEWLVEAYTWVSETQRIKVACSELCSSRKVACVM